MIITPRDREDALKITAKQAYEWVKTDHWNLKTFEIWLDHVICNAEYNAKYYNNL
jgi:hypothetical protein